MSEQRENGGGIAYQAGMMKRHPASGTFVASDGLTEQQSEFVRHMLLNGGDEIDAVKKAGYSEGRTSQALYHLRRNPRVMDALRREREAWINTRGASLAVKTLEALMLDPATSGQVKLQAAKFTLEAAGHGLAAQKARMGLPDADKPLSEMSLTELEAFLSAGRQAVETIKQEQAKTIEGEATPL